MMTTPSPNPGKSEKDLEKTQLFTPTLVAPSEPRTTPETLEKTQVIPPKALGVTDIYQAQELNATAVMPSEPLTEQPPTVVPRKVQKVSVLGDFRLVAKLGEGAMGTVYKAIQQSVSRFVAVKVLSKTMASREGFVDRFRREARIISALHHPNIVASFGFGEAYGFHYLAMELVEGGTLSGYIEERRRLSVPEATYVTLACANALQYAHELNLVHRDIKPDNIMLTSEGVVKMADLGLAKDIEDVGGGLTMTGVGVGTPLYAAPEQLRDAKRVDARCDIYSLGCVYYFLLTNQLPFTGSNLVELIRAKEKGTFNSAKRLNKDVPDTIDRILTRMLAKLPEHRYQTCAEVAQELDFTGIATRSLDMEQ